jgi:hypothetical protein
LDKDNVHLSFGENGKAAAALLHRILRPDARARMVKQRRMEKEDQHASWSSKTELFP